MARITFSLQELVDIAVSNEILPRQIVRVRVKGQRIHFVVRTNLFVLPFVPASLGYAGFDGNNVLFELAIAGGHANKIVGWFRKIPEFEMPAFVKLDFPNVSVDIDRLLEERNVRGIRVDSVVLEDSQLTIVADAGPSGPLDPH